MTSGHTILLVDDGSLAGHAGKELEAAGLRVQLVGSPDRALHMLASGEYRAMVVNMAAVGQKGWTLCNQTRGRDDTATIPLVVTHADADSQMATMHSRLRTRADAYLGMLPQQGVLASTVRECIEGSPAQGPRVIPAEPIRATCPQCHAPIELQPDAQVARCDHCGADALATLGHAPSHEHADPSAPTARPASGGRSSSVLVLIVTVLVVGVALLLWNLNARS